MYIWLISRIALLRKSRIGGYTYSDVIHIYGVSRAGYVPQLFSLRLPNPVVIYELLAKAGAMALVCDSVTSGFVVGNSPVPVLQAPTFCDINPSLHTEPSLPLPSHEASECAFIFHTSGSTSGSPKLVPCDYRCWMPQRARLVNCVCPEIRVNRMSVPGCKS